jgi:hypothetical protein
MRKYPQMSPEEFLQSDEPHLFRVNCSTYAEFHKFKKWMLQEIESRKSQKSYDEQVNELHGDFNIQDQFSESYEVRNTSPIFDYCREQLYSQYDIEDFQPKVQTKGKKAKKAKKVEWKAKSAFDLPFVPAEQLGEEFVITD